MTNKEVMETLKNLKVNRLYKRVINEIIEDSKEYDGKNLQECITARLYDVGRGLSTGIVGSMIYYKDTVRFFKTYKEEIANIISENGYNPQDFNGYDEEDYFCKDTNNMNLLAWFAYEFIASELLNQLEDWNCFKVLPAYMH